MIWLKDSTGQKGFPNSNIFSSLRTTISKIGEIDKKIPSEDGSWIIIIAWETESGITLEYLEGKGEDDQDIKNLIFGVRISIDPVGIEDTEMALDFISIRDSIPCQIDWKKLNEKLQQYIPS